MLAMNLMTAYYSYGYTYGYGDVAVNGTRTANDGLSMRTHPGSSGTVGQFNARWTSLTSTPSAESSGCTPRPKGRTTSPGLDVDALCGQLFRRMRDPEEGARYAVVVPTPALSAALRVPAWVRARLSVDVYEVDDDSEVHLRE